MKSVAFWVVGLFLLVVQGNLYPVLGSLGVQGATPSLILPLLLFLGVHESRMLTGAVLAFGLGYAADILAAAPVGIFSITSVVCWWLTRVAGVRLSSQSWLARIVLSFGFSLIESVLVLILLTIFGADPQRSLELGGMVFAHAVSTGLSCLLVFPLAERVAWETSASGMASGESS